MTDPGYNLVEIVDAVRRAGNPQKAALEALADTDGLTDAVLLDALGGLEEFASVWDGVLTDPKGPFSTEQVETLAQINETASIWLNGWDAAALVLTGGEGHE